VFRDQVTLVRRDRLATRVFLAANVLIVPLVALNFFLPLGDNAPIVLADAGFAVGYIALAGWALLPRQRRVPVSADERGMLIDGTWFAREDIERASLWPDGHTPGGWPARLLLDTRVGKLGLETGDEQRNRELCSELGVAPEELN
jgi:hypothetical protein